MDEIHAGAGALRQANHAAKRQVFHRLGMDQMDVVPIPVTSLLGQKIVVHDQLVVLAVDRQDTVMLGDLRHHVMQAAGVEFAAWR